MPSLISAHTGIFFRFAKRQGNITELGTHILGVEEAQAESSEIQHSTSAKQSRLDRGDTQQQYQHSEIAQHLTPVSKP